MNVYGNAMMESKREANSQSSADGAQARGEESKMKRAARAVVLSHFTAEAGLLPFFALAVKTSDARKPMKSLVAGGGFEPPTFGL